MLFNRAKSIDILPKIKIGNKDIEVVDELTLLGIIIRSDLNWNSNTNALVGKAYKRIWMLRNLKRYGASKQELVDVYIKQVRSLLEKNCPVWHPGISQNDSKKLERVQRVAVAIIKGEQKTSYITSLLDLKLETLEIRRKRLCQKFAIKAFKHPKFSKWFCKEKLNVNTRSHKSHLKEIRTRTKQFRKSSIPYLTNLLNQLPKLPKK